MDPTRIVIIGAGNLASHLGPALRDAGYEILQVYSRTGEAAMELAGRLDAGWTTDLSELDDGAQILLYAVSDNIMPELFCRIELSRRMMVHTSGSIPANVFNGVARDFGVLYPVMTFTKGRSLDFRNIPVCFEGNNEFSSRVLRNMAGRISNRVREMDSDQRKILHLAGIIASNFTNHMYSLSGDYLRENGLDLNLIKPLILETAEKILELDPGSAQTGPARRNDTDIIREHIAMLEDRPELQKLYTFVSDSIINHFSS